MVLIIKTLNYYVKNISLKLKRIESLSYFHRPIAIRAN